MYPKVDLTEKLASVPDVIEQPRSASLDVCPREGGGGAEYVVGRRLGWRANYTFGNNAVGTSQRDLITRKIGSLETLNSIFYEY